MKFLYLAFIFLVINYCSADNRTTVWLLADGQIFSSDLSYLPCKAQVSGGTILKLKSDYLTITGTTTKSILTGAAIGGATSTSAIVGTENAAVYTAIALAFKTTDGGSTITKTITLSAFATKTALDTLIDGIFTDPNGNILDTLTIRTPSGSAWLYLERTGYYDEGAAADPSVSWRAVQITDNQSNSTISVTAWQDGSDVGGGSPANYNHFYMVTVRTATTNFDSGLLKVGCTSVRTSKKKRDLRASTLTSCPMSSTSYTDSSIENNKAKICTYASASSTYFGNAVSVGGKIVDTVRSTDTTYFGAAGSKFSIASSFGVLIALSSIIFSLLN